MLFGYKYISHDIEKMQKYIDFLFLKIWCKAEGEFNIEKLNGCPDLKQIVLDVKDNSRIKKDHLQEPIKKIYDSFKNFNKEETEELENWYIKNNSIEELCNNSNNYTPLTYSDLKKFNEVIADDLKEFFINLYENVIDLTDVKNKIGSIDHHYNEFTKENDEELCPFCGLHDLKGPYSSKREAYDHYLPKATYAFSSINFKNLAPMCHECNSSYKLKTDPLYENRMPNRDPLHSPERKRRKAFYPYNTDPTNIKIEVHLLNNDIPSITPEEIELEITSGDFQEEVETWKEIFGIEERFKDILRKKNKGKAWLQQIIEESANCNISPMQLLNAKKKYAETNRWGEANFLRIPFLEACEKKKIIK
ncbi:hypothetical protein [Priestia aryabhattai]|uniref:hypothetical protein n=1 Tax=Priestia aryabhattai TaxID=412384 RepID=UPI001C8D8AA7|nr:hypothetical protein [Priestia aryabhattai]MBX9986358.1 hypothetical protein [Priestia aryabhattai]MBY0001973.1 hypothetical protein [Priestia aryabhattai]